LIIETIESKAYVLSGTLSYICVV